MHFSHHNPTYSYHLNEHILEKTDHEKDLKIPCTHCRSYEKGEPNSGCDKKSLIAHKIREQSQHYTKNNGKTAPRIWQCDMGPLLSSGY